jgi:MFS superfamily sulfate permease-like transporter
MERLLVLLLVLAGLYALIFGVPVAAGWAVSRTQVIGWLPASLAFFVVELAVVGVMKPKA